MSRPTLDMRAAEAARAVRESVTRMPMPLRPVDRRVPMGLKLATAGVAVALALLPFLFDSLPAERGDVLPPAAPRATVAPSPAANPAPGVQASPGSSLPQPPSRAGDPPVAVPIPQPPAGIPAQHGLAFVRNGQIHVRPAGESDSLALLEGRQPAFSPDGRFIAFTRDRGVTSDIRVVSVGGASEGYTLTFGDTLDSAPGFSPDGRSVVFQREPTVGSSGAVDVRPALYVAPFDRSGSPEMIPGTEGASDPSWSPDGRLIAFATGEGLFTIAPDGSNLTQLTDEAVSEPDWAHDGGRLVVVVTDAETSAIAEISAAGGPLHLRTQRRTNVDTSPAFSPDGKRIAFIRGSELLELDLASGKLRTLERDVGEGVDYAPR